MAVTLSAFTSKTNNPPVTVWFRDGGAGAWISQSLTPCVEGSDPVCEVATIGYGTERIYKTANTTQPFTKE